MLQMISRLTLFNPDKTIPMKFTCSGKLIFSTFQWKSRFLGIFMINNAKVHGINVKNGLKFLSSS